MLLVQGPFHEHLKCVDGTLAVFYYSLGTKGGRPVGQKKCILEHDDVNESVPQETSSFTERIDADTLHCGLGTTWRAKRVSLQRERTQETGTREQGSHGNDPCAIGIHLFEEKESVLQTLAHTSTHTHHRYVDNVVKRVCIQHCY